MSDLHVFVPQPQVSLEEAISQSAAPRSTTVQELDDNLWLEAVDATFCHVIGKLDKYILDVLRQASRPMNASQIAMAVRKNLRACAARKDFGAPELGSLEQLVHAPQSVITEKRVAMCLKEDLRKLVHVDRSAKWSLASSTGRGSSISNDGPLKPRRGSCRPAAVSNPPRLDDAKSVNRGDAPRPSRTLSRRMSSERSGELGSVVPRFVRADGAPSGPQGNADSLEIEHVFGQFEWLMLNSGRDLEKFRSIANELATKGFKETTLLKWAAELESQKQQLQAAIDANGGIADVWTLFDLQGRPINAKVINRKSRVEWQILDASGRATGKRVPYRPSRKSVLARRGYVEAKERRLAVAMIVFGIEDVGWAHIEAVPVPKLADDKL